MGELIRPGDALTSFFVSPGRCFRMVYSKQLQGTHCYEATEWRGRFTDAKGKVHRVWACEGHADELVGVRCVLSPIQLEF